MHEKITHQVGQQTYSGQRQEDAGPQQWVKFEAPSQKAAALFIPLDIVIKIARSLPLTELLGEAELDQQLRKLLTDRLLA